MKKAKVPQLRFSEFKKEWREITLGNKATKVGSGITPKGGSQVYTDNGVLFIRSQNVENNTLLLDDITFIPEEIHKQMNGSQVQPSDILLNITGASIGRSCVVPDTIDEANVNQHVCIIRLKSENEPRFYQSILASEKGERLIYKHQAGGGREGLNFANIRSFKLYIPDFIEQQKIADFLSSVDKKIQQLRRKKELLEEYKKGVMQKLFPSADGQAPEIRFKDENGNDFPDWKYKSMGEVFDRVTRKNNEDNQNVLTISAQDGLINQEEYFNRPVAAKDLTGYYLLKKDEFAYNKSYSNGYPLGAIKRLTEYDKGVVSTLYICFKLKEGNSEEFYEEFLDHGGINHEIYKIAQEGSRNHGLLNVSVVDFFKDIEVPQPSLKEQKRIASFLNSISNKTEIVSTKLDLAEEFKKGLLQQMFV